jgi:hypothetical protein
MASFDHVNYSIRPNKSVERKLVFTNLSKIQKELEFKSYRYVGFGSLWFTDFLIAHKLLKIKSMVSIEASETGADRARFNQPLSCIKVEEGDSSTLIPILDFDKTKSIVWLDYDTGIDGPALRDIELLLPMIATGSIFLVTISAKVNSLPKVDENNSTITKAQSIKEIAGDYVPTTLPRARFEKEAYPKLLLEILNNAVESIMLNSGRQEKFLKLFEMIYKDGTPMVSFGGIVSNQETITKIQSIMTSENWDGIINDPIQVPPLTLKEKITMDRFMPTDQPPTSQNIKDGSGLSMEQEQIDAYHRYYLHYPVFGEVVF